MYTYIAYLGEEGEDIVNTEKSLLITAAGYYRVHTTEWVETNRPLGRGDYQLLYVAEGEVQFIFDGKEKIVSKGNMILFRPGEPQVYNMYAVDKPETYWIHFTGSEAEDLLNHFQIPKGVFFTGTSTDYQWMFRQMIQELQLRRERYEEMLRIDLRRLLLIICRYLKEGKKTRSEILDEIERATHYFNEHYNEPIIIEEYAVKHLMTPGWFIKNFKKITNVTPMQHIVSLRIANAKILLSSTYYNISQIAATVGYENALYFSRLFRKHTGMSPSEYRKRGKEKT